MVSFNTVNAAISGKTAPESDLADFLERSARDRGFDTFRIDVSHQCSNLLISFEVDSSKPWMLFDSHLDTVSVDGMTVDPFAAEIADGKLYGRGACDTKGSGAAMLTALTAYAKSCESGTSGAGGDSHGYNIMLLYSVDEEQGMSGIRAFVDDYLSSSSRRVIGAVVGEPTGLEPVVAHNGVQRYRIATRGIATHSADPSRGRSAISDMARLIIHLEDEYIPSLEAKHELTGMAQCSINVIRGGTAANIIPERCEIEVDRRTVPGEASLEVVEELKTRLDEYLAANAGVEIDFMAAVETPPLTPKGDHGFLDGICAVVKSSGRCGNPIGVRYATHAGDLCVAGLPSVVLGPGDIDQGHTKNEWIDVSELEAAVPLYLQIMRGEIS